MATSKSNFWSSPLTRSRITSDDVKMPEMLLGYFIGPFGALLSSGIFTSILQNYFTDVLRARGHISLCEILDDTGITLDKPLSLAELYGHFWSYAKGDRFVDLGIPKEYDCNTKSFELDINI